VTVDEHLHLVAARLLLRGSRGLLEPSLRDEAAQRAATEGITVSEVMRRALRQYLRSA